MKDDRPLLDQTADDAQCVMDGALCLLDHQLVGASHHDAYGLSRTGAASDLDKRDDHDRYIGKRKKEKKEGRKRKERNLLQPIEMKTNLDQLAGALQVDLLCQLSGAQHLRSEVVNVGNGFGANGLKRRMTVVGEFRGTDS